MPKPKVYRGGVIPYFYDTTNGEIMMLFMRPTNTKRGGSEYQIAKGKCEEKEDIETTAFREAREELGLFKPNCSRIRKLGDFMGRTAIYTCLVDDPSDDMFGDPCSETADTKWMNMKEFASEGRSLHVPIVQAAIRDIIINQDE